MFCLNRSRGQPWQPFWIFNFPPEKIFYNKKTTILALDSVLIINHKPQSSISLLRFINDIRGPDNLNRFPADWTSVLWITFVQQDPPFWNFDQRHQNKVNISSQCHNNGVKHSRTDVLCSTWRDNQSLTFRLLTNLCFTARSPQSGALAISLFWQLSLGSCHHGHRRFLGQESPISDTNVTEGQTVYRELNTTANRDYESEQPADKTQWQSLTLMDSAIPGAVKPLDHVGTTTYHDHSASSSAHTQGIPRHRPQNEMVAVVDLTARRWHLTVLQTTIFRQLPRNKQSWEF